MVVSVRERAAVLVQRQLDRNAFAGLGPLRRHLPVLSVPPYAVVTRREDVDAVLADSETFAPPYAPRLTGPFVLGLAGADHERHTRELRCVLRADDLPQLGQSAGQLAQAAVDGRTGSLDVGADLVQPVLSALVERYLGVGAPDRATQLRWTRDLFQDIFLNQGGLPSVRRRAERSGAELCRYVDDLVASRPHGPAALAVADGDVLSRLLARQVEAPGTALDDREIRDNLVGLAIGWLWHGAKAAITAVDELLDTPEAGSAAQAAADADDLPQLQRVLWEVLRFRPVQAGVFRTCTRDTTLAAGTPRARPVGVGTTVLVGMHSGMWDETVVPDPARFDPTRADAQYLVFGAGPHRCLGEAIVKAQLPALLAPLLRRSPRRAQGRAGRLRWSGPSPDGFRVVLSDR